LLFCFFVSSVCFVVDAVVLHFPQSYVL